MKNNIGEARRSYALTVEKFTQKDAAAFFGISTSTYKKWEQGVTMLNSVQLSAVADKYGVSTDYLLCRTDAPGAAGGISLATDRERDRLVAHYANMNDEGRETLVELAAMMDESGRYGKKAGAPRLRKTA